ncbi:hypothetical protein D3C76_1183080 [compost metagenome]
MAAAVLDDALQGGIVELLAIAAPTRLGYRRVGKVVARAIEEHTDAQDDAGLFPGFLQLLLFFLFLQQRFLLQVLGQGRGLGAGQQVAGHGAGGCGG